MREPGGFEHLLARTQPFSSGAKVLDEGCARGERIEASAQPGSGRTGLGATGGREFEHAVGPGEEAVHVHKAGVGAHGGRHSTRENGLLKFARDATTDGHKGLESRVMLVGTLEYPRRSV